MPLQNRVDPFGLIHSVPDRGLFMGNRGGCFHNDDQTLKSTHWKTRQWITCVLEFKDRKRELMQSGLYTELFFLDEPTSLAAGHRPCYECRYSDAKAFREALIKSGFVGANPRAPEISDAISGEIQNVLSGRANRQALAVEDLPDGAMFTTGATAFLKWKGLAWPWQFSGYESPVSLPEQAVRLTPQLTCEALAHGYSPRVHSSIPTAT